MDRGGHTICIVSSSGTFVNNELTSNDVMVIRLRPVCKTKRVLDRELIRGDGRTRYDAKL